MIDAFLERVYVVMLSENGQLGLAKGGIHRRS